MLQNFPNWAIPLCALALLFTGWIAGMLRGTDAYREVCDHNTALEYALSVCREKRTRELARYRQRVTKYRFHAGAMQHALMREKEKVKLLRTFVESFTPSTEPGKKIKSAMLQKTAPVEWRKEVVDAE